MLLDELYCALMLKMGERERFCAYARMGDLMERYRETRDERLIEEFNKLFKLHLIRYGLWEAEDDVSITDSPKETIKDGYSRLRHFLEYMRSYQGNNKLRMKDEDVNQIVDYFRENYSLDMITRSEIGIVCKKIGKKSAKGNEMHY